mgnify:CR=1 FL=1
MATSAITHLIIFIAVLSITTTAVFTMSSFVTSSSDAINLQRRETTNVINTDIRIELVHYDSNSEELYAYVENSGKTTLKLEDINIYVNNIRIPREIENRTIEIIPDTEIKNSGLWDPSEEIFITININLESDNHNLIITTSYQGKDEYLFST